MGSPSAVSRTAFRRSKVGASRDLGAAAAISAARWIISARPAEVDVGHDPARGPGDHRPDAEAGGLQCAEAGLDDPHARVAERAVGGGERVVAGGQDALAVELFGPADLGAIDVGPALVVEREIGAEARGRDLPAGGLGVIAGEAVELPSKRLQDLLAVAPLPLGFFGNWISITIRFWLAPAAWLS
mgnify:CR=1 FL=1